MTSLNPQTKRIVAIHDLSGFGRCSLTVALPVISASGVECSCIPTAVLSTHTAIQGFQIRDLSTEIVSIAGHWSSLGLHFDGIYSGYLASPEQAHLLETVIAMLKKEDTLVIIDPVMADNGEYYSALDDRMCCAFRKLCASADVITPNITEAALLAGIPYEEAPHSPDYIHRLLTALSKLCKDMIVLTGVHPTKEQVGVVALNCKTGATYMHMNPIQDGAFYGTGDIFASALAALLVRGVEMDAALKLSLDLVNRSICRTAALDVPREYGVDFESVLPEYVLQVGALCFEQ
ncbi:MAG: pyridoxamine kinase [Oscillospiraceae bacterium]|jgi:pyridoxine kinase